MEISDIIWLSIAAVIAAYLLFRRWQRQMQPAPESHWTGHGIDVTGITDRVQRVRSDFVSESMLRPYDVRQRRGLLALATRAIRRLAYFRKRSSHTDHDTETHGA